MHTNDVLFSTRSLLQADAVGRLKSSAENNKLHFSASAFCCTEKVNFSICLNEQSHYIKSALHLFNAAFACSRIKLLPLSHQNSEYAKKPVLFMALLKKKKRRNISKSNSACSTFPKIFQQLLMLVWSDLSIPVCHSVR